ncbi:MAG: tRNA lysidine(34) synthetase TilS [Bacilli bacterium]|nr:tRNA lysidine(34) synthetase TilS [Bacilli bacterium]
MICIDHYFHFQSGDIIVVGCSTGPDSMALLDMLLNIREKYQLQLIVAHVNHNIRYESYNEARFLRNYCEQHALFFEDMVIEDYGDDNFHNEARNIRYHFFDSVVHKYHANYLMTAHHGDDLIETILMRMVRGSNLNGYSGFKDVVDMGTYKIVRPLIHFTKQELEDYDINHGVPFFVDESNMKDTYTRNRYRKYLLPFLKSEDPNVHKKFLKFSNTIQEANQFISRFTEKALKRCINDDKILLDQFLLEDEFIQKEILFQYLSNYYQDDLLLINDKHIDLIMNIIKSRKANISINLPNEVLAKKEYNTLYFSRDVDTITSYEIEFDSIAFLPNNHSIERIESTDLNNNCICRLNSSEISLPLIIRTRKLGDKISMKGTNGSRKVKDIFIDKKISLHDRDLWPIVLDSLGNIVWIPGIKKSKFDKTLTDKYDIILKYN